jgi:hypothetical protein
MATEAEIALLRRLIPERRHFTILDGRNPDAPVLQSVFVRSWAPAGFVQRTLHTGSLPSFTHLKEELAEEGSLVLTADRPLLDDLAGQMSALPGTLLVQHRQGQFYHAGQPLSDREPVESQTGRTSLLVEGKTALMRQNISLPQVFRVHPCAVAGRSLVRVEGMDPFERLPGPRWFRVVGPARVEMRVEVHPSPVADRWEVMVNGQPADPVAAPTLTAARRLERIGLVFDRTCPDRASWSDARLLLDIPGEFKNDRGVPLWPRFNQSIRDGVVEVFRTAEEYRTLQVHLACFADVPGKELASVEGVDMPLTATGDLGTRPADRLGDLLDGCTYSPGLDLWDPLEEALRLVAGPLLRQPRPGTGILIIGNSPPNLPLDGTSPLYGLLDQGGIATTSRRRSSLFTNLIRQLDDQGIPIVYLFLTHDRCGVQEADALHVFQGLHEKIRQILTFYLKVVTTPADAEGVARGLAEAIAFLSDPPISGVLIEETEGG